MRAMLRNSASSSQGSSTRPMSDSSRARAITHGAPGTPRISLGFARSPSGVTTSSNTRTMVIRPAERSQRIARDQPGPVSMASRRASTLARRDEFGMSRVHCWAIAATGLEIGLPVSAIVLPWFCHGSVMQLISVMRLRRCRDPLRQRGFVPRGNSKLEGAGLSPLAASSQSSKGLLAWNLRSA